MNIPLSLRIRQWSWWWMNVMETAHLALIFWIGPFSKLAIQLWYREATSGFGHANGAFGNSRFQSSSFYYNFFFWRRRELLPLPSPVALECALAHPANAQRYTHRTQFFYLLIYFFWRDQWDLWQDFSSFSITEFFRMAPPTCSCCEPIYRAFFCLVHGGVG